MTKLSPDAASPRKLNKIQTAALDGAFNKIDSIDRCISRITETLPDQMRGFGGNVRSHVGRNLLTHLTDDDLGETVALAIIDRLLQVRGELVALHEQIADFPAPPCPPQRTTKDLT